MEQRKNFLKIIITFRVFGVIPSYLVCIELIGDVLRKQQNFWWKIKFPMKILNHKFWDFSKIQIFEKSQNSEKSQNIWPWFESKFEICLLQKLGATVFWLSRVQKVTRNYFIDMFIGRGVLYFALYNLRHRVYRGFRRIWQQGISRSEGDGPSVRETNNHQKSKFSWEKDHLLSS